MKNKFYNGKFGLTNETITKQSNSRKFPTNTLHLSFQEHQFPSTEARTRRSRTYSGRIPSTIN